MVFRRGRSISPHEGGYEATTTAGSEPCYVADMGEPWRVKYDGVCARRETPPHKGSPAVWDRATRSIRCVTCPLEASPPPPAAVIETGTAGRSARVRYDHPAAKRDTANADRWGTGIVAKVIRAVSDEPQSTRAWAIGAAGEEKLAADLDDVPGIRMLHDRRIPGTRRNIDHIVIGPAGIFVVDAKNHKGRLEIRDRGGLLRSDLRLTVGGRDISSAADGVLSQADVVATVLERAGIELAPSVTPVLCFLRVEWPLLRPPSVFRGVRLENDRSVRRLVTTRSTLAEAQADHLLSTLAAGLPPR